LETGAKEEFRSVYGFDFDVFTPSPWFSDFQAIFGQLQVVANNGPTRIGGGGTPRAPLAAPVSGPGVPAITATLSASPGTISPGGAATLTWSVSDGTASLDQGLGSVALSGSRTVTPGTTTTYTLSASTSAGSVTRTVTVVVR
jgi:hypothetical protein